MKVEIPSNSVFVHLWRLWASGLRRRVVEHMAGVQFPHLIIFCLIHFGRHSKTIMQQNLNLYLRALSVRCPLLSRNSTPLAQWQNESKFVHAFKKAHHFDRGEKVIQHANTASNTLKPCQRPTCAHVRCSHIPPTRRGPCSCNQRALQKQRIRDQS